MLPLPDDGISLSAKEHNSDMSVLCDWVEASVLLKDEALSLIEVTDVLLEEEVYRDQDFASELVEQIWSIVDRRQGWLGASRAIHREGSRLVPDEAWPNIPAHTFCLVIALRRCFKQWSVEVGPNYVEQGRLFERVTEEALVALGWEVLRTGWDGLADPPPFVEIVGSIANRINEMALVELDVPQEVKDQGLDLICLRPFRDRRGGHLLHLVQCASGANWRSKLRTPSFELWRDLIRFTSPYPRAIAVPFAFPEDDRFRAARLSSDGFFLDRFRILAAGFEERGWESEELRDSLVTWLGPLVESLTVLT